jgi:hypothetical protein
MGDEFDSKMEPIMEPIMHISLDTFKETPEILGLFKLFNDKSITNFIKSCIPELRHSDVKNTDDIIMSEYGLTPDDILEISNLLLDSKFLELCYAKFRLDRYIEKTFEKLYTNDSTIASIEMLQQMLQQTRILPTRHNIKLLLSLYIFYSFPRDPRVDIQLPEKYIAEFNAYFLTYYDPTDHTRELLVEFQSKNVLTKYRTPKKFQDVINGDFYLKFIQSKRPYTWQDYHTLGLFQMEHFIDPETGTQNINFSIVKDEIYIAFAQIRIDEITHVIIPFMTVLEWYATDDKFKHFLNTIFEKALFDFSIHLKRTSREQFHAGKTYILVDMYYNRPRGRFAWHQDHTKHFRVEFFTLSHVDERLITDPEARTGHFDHAFIGPGVTKTPMIKDLSQRHTSGYLAASNGDTFGIDNSLFIHTTPDPTYDVSVKGPSTKEVEYTDRFNNQFKFIEDRGGRLTTETQQYAAKTLKDFTAQSKRSFIRLWFSTNIAAAKVPNPLDPRKTIHLNSSDQWRLLNHPLFCESYNERCIDRECLDFIQKAHPDDFDMVTLRRCVLNTLPEEKEHAIAFREKYVSCIPLPELGKLRLYCNALYKTSHKNSIILRTIKPRQLNNIAYPYSLDMNIDELLAKAHKLAPLYEEDEDEEDEDEEDEEIEQPVILRKRTREDSKEDNPKPPKILQIPLSGGSAREEEHPKEEFKYFQYDEPMPPKKKDIIDMVCSFIAKVEKYAVIKNISTDHDTEHEIDHKIYKLLREVGMGKKKSKKHKKHKKSRKSKTKTTKKHKTKKTKKFKKSKRTNKK